MNKPYNNLEIKSLEKGFTPTPFPNRKQRRSKEWTSMVQKFQDMQALQLAEQLKNGELEVRDATELLKEL